MTLPSNSSMTIFPNNTLTTYKTLLDQYVTSSVPMECALQEITCPTTWYNVVKEPVVVIEGVPSKTQDPSLKRLQNTLIRRHREFFKNNSHNLNLSQEQTTPRHSEDVKVLNKGCRIKRTSIAVQPSEVVVAAPTAAVEETRLRGVLVDRKKRDTEEGELSATTEDEAETLISDVNRKKRKRALESSLENYSETGRFISSGKLEMTAAEVQSVKVLLPIKAVDKVARVTNFAKSRTYTAFYIEGAYLTTNSELIDYLNREFIRNYPQLIERVRLEFKHARNTHLFHYNPYSRRCTICLPKGVILQLPENLAWQLGFEGGTFLINKTTSSHVVDLQYRAQTIYVYSDIVRDSIVGDKRAPLLRVVNVNPKYGDTQTVAFQPLIYQPLSKTSFRQISVYLRDHTGQPIPFERGTVNVVLAFRPSINLL